MAPGHWLALALWLPLMLTAATAEERRPCSPNKCGNHTISHPFWLPDRATGRSCGSPDFEVTCKDKITPVILTSAAISLGFAILRVSYEDRSLHVVDLGKRYLLQQAPNSCLVPIWNTSAKLSAPFTISPGSLGLVLYSCPEAAGAAALALGGGELVRTGMRCGNESQVLVRAGGRYNGTGGYGRYEGCDSAVMPVLGANGEANASDYVRLIDDGFFLTWELPPPQPE
uniref:Wall-associated receptor kinase galacturonan-binding domain-containing protein n=1 Tax=Hordeum vulgare subsp. vulgare TaxID=112509 RepID=A0A8I6XIZ4_HORVV